MGAMSEMIVTCAGCGKRFKGVAGPKRYKCSACENQFTFPDSPRIPNDGTVLCSCCWTGYEASEKIQSCIVCDQRISMQFGGRAAIAAPRDVASSASLPVVDKNRISVETKMNELQSRLALWQESQAAVIKERDELAQAKRDLEGQLVALTTRMSDLQKSQAATTQERDIAHASRQPLEEKIVELKTRLAMANEAQQAAQQELQTTVEMRLSIESRVTELQRHVSEALEAQNAAIAERESADEARKAAEREMIEVKAKLNAQGELQAQALKDRDAAIVQQKMAEEKVVELQTRLETGAEAQATGLKDREELLNIRRSLEEKIATLQGRLAASDEGRVAAVASREELLANNQQLEKRLDEATSELSMLREIQSTFQADREKIVAEVKNERVKLYQTQSSLKHFKNLTATALRPLGSEYSRIARELTEQTDALFKLSMQTQDELDQRREKLKQLERTLRGQLDALCRSFTELVSEENTASSSGMMTAVVSGDSNSKLTAIQSEPESLPASESNGDMQSFDSQRTGEAIFQPRVTRKSVAPGGE
jgi:chromosome segregation ATPase